MKQPKGFSLFELLVYVTITAVATVILTAFVADLVRGGAKVLAVKEVNQNTRLMLSQLSQTIKTAQALTTVNSTELTLVDHDGVTIRLYYDGTAKALFLDDGSLPVAISNQSVVVDSFLFEPVANQAVRMTMTVSQKNKVVVASQPYQLTISSVAAARPLQY